MHSVTEPLKNIMEQQLYSPERTKNLTERQKKEESEQSLQCD